MLNKYFYLHLYISIYLPQSDLSIYLSIYPSIYLPQSYLPNIAQVINVWEKLLSPQNNLRFPFAPWSPSLAVSNCKFDHLLQICIGEAPLSEKVQLVWFQIFKVSKRSPYMIKNKSNKGDNVTHGGGSHPVLF